MTKSIENVELSSKKTSRFLINTTMVSLFNNSIKGIMEEQSQLNYIQNLHTNLEAIEVNLVQLSRLLVLVDDALKSELVPGAAT